MDFDKLMSRYDNMVRQLAFYQSENKTLESKLAWEKERVDKLQQELQDCRSKPGNMAPHYNLAKEVYSMDPMMLKIEMIKEVRHRAGWGLAEAKEAVEKVLAEDKSTPVERLLRET